MTYAVREDYDSRYKVKNREIACYSKSKMKKLFPDGNFRVIGETLPDNKKQKLDTVELGGRSFIVSKEGSHSSLFTRTVGYVNDGKGEYIALLRKNFLLLWILLGILAIAAALILIPPESNSVLAPDYKLVEDDPGAVTQTDRDVPEDQVIIYLPKGNIELDIKSDTGLKPGKTGKVKIILTVDGVDYEIFDDAVTINDDGTLPALMLDFTKVHVELKAGRYLGWIIFTAPDGTETKLPILIVIRNTYGGSVTVGYSTQVMVDRTTGNITMMYSHGFDASHDCILQLILDNGGEEYLLSQSGTLHPGQMLTAMTLDPDITEQLTSGVYHGRLRVNLYNGETEQTNINTDIEVTITVQ